MGRAFGTTSRSGAPSRPPAAAPVGVILSSVLLLTLTGCLGPVEQQSPPRPEPSEAAICAAVMSALPDQVLDRGRRDSRPAELTAAWGDPPISLRCGIDRPAAMNAASECFEVNGVGWFAEPGVGGMVFTTIGRAVYVEVGVPDSYAPEANALVDLTPAMGRNPLLDPCL